MTKKYMKNTEKHGKSRYIGMNIRKILKNQGKLQVNRNTRIHSKRNGAD